MSPSPTVPMTEVVEVTPPNRPTISWGSVIAGMFTAIAVQIALAELCIAAGLAMYSPFEANSANASTLAIGTIIAWIVCALAGLFLGGWVAGRLAHYHSRMIAGLHGILVWAAGAVVAAVLVTTTVGMIAGGTLSLVGDGVQAAARGAQAVAPVVAEIAAPSWDAVRSQIDAAASKTAAAAQAGTLDNRLAEASRMSDLLGKFFSREADQRLTKPETDELATILAAQVGISREAAVKTIAQWQSSWDATVNRYDAAVAEAKEKAAQAAVAAKNFTATAAAMAFALMLVGFFAAMLGGVCGSMIYRTEGETEEGGVTAVRRTAPSFG
ncbi:MAG: hypothetical protein H0W78_00630 [Planctomycetes bacterium]|nr:hypothetical protein [Planctomycetota bacterium]